MLKSGRVHIFDLSKSPALLTVVRRYHFSGKMPGCRKNQEIINPDLEEPCCRNYPVLYLFMLLEGLVIEIFLSNGPFFAEFFLISTRNFAMGMALKIIEVIPFFTPTYYHSDLPHGGPRRTGVIIVMCSSLCVAARIWVFPYLQ